MSSQILKNLNIFFNSKDDVFQPRVVEIEAIFFKWHLSCRSAAQGVTWGLRDRAVMCHPMVPTAWPHVGPELIVGIHAPLTAWLGNCLEWWLMYVHKIFLPLWFSYMLFSQNYCRVNVLIWWLMCVTYSFSYDLLLCNFKVHVLTKTVLKDSNLFNLLNCTFTQIETMWVKSRSVQIYV